MSAGPAGASGDSLATARLRMVEEQIERRGVRDEGLLAALRRVPRHLFVPEAERGGAYEDWPLPVGHGQTISQPYIVACMTEAAGVRPSSRVLEIGTGSGYQAAILAEMGAEVCSIEIVEALADAARFTLRSLGYASVEVRTGDGYRGWPDRAPFDIILVTAAPVEVPPPLLEQLAPGGRLLLPLGSGAQELVRITRGARGMERETLLAVRFVPMTGEALDRPR